MSCCPDDNVMDRVSVVIPTYNREQLVGRALDSILAQTSVDWECWVIDDFSTDHTKEVVQKYCENDSRIHYALNQFRKGAQGARNTGIKLCGGNWVLLLDSDNSLTNDYVEKILSYIRSHPDVDVVTNFIQNIGPNQEKSNVCQWVTEGKILRSLLNERTYVDNSSACIRKEKLFSIGLLDENCPSYQEWDTHIRLAKCCKYGCVREPLTNYFDHKGSRISQNTTSVYGKGLYVLKKHKKTWLSIAGKGVYSRLLLHVYDQHRTSPFFTRLRVLSIVCRLSPNLCKQLVKRRLNSSKR